MQHTGKGRRKIGAAALALLLFSGILSGCRAQEQPEETELFAMSTYITQKVYGPEKTEAAQAVNDLIQTLEEKLSLYIEGSDVSRINQNAGVSPVKVDAYTFELLQTAKEYSAASQGSFDITIAPLTLLWGTTGDNPRVPAQSEIDAVLPLVDYANLQLDEENQTVYLTEKGMAIDLGGIAKGYIAGRIEEEYEKWDVTSALVSIGGNIDVFGRKPDGSRYTLGIRDPASQTGILIIGKLQAEDCVVATAGAYERYFEQDGVVYHHILDPNTGYPAQTDLLSVSVISEDGGLADFLSTTLFMAGREHIEDYIHDSRFDVIVIDKQHNVYVSDGIRGRFELTNTEEYTLAGSPASGEPEGTAGEEGA